MVGSIKLLIAALGASRFGGVMGARGDEKEQVRRSLRKGSVIPDAGVEEERKMQFIANFPQDEIVPMADHDDAPGYDDFFGPPQQALDAVDPADDDFFAYTNSGMEYDWNGASQHGHGHSHDDDHSVTDHLVGTKSAKFMKGVAKNDKIEKAAKVGKMMWDESPVMIKSGKHTKDAKSLKAKISYKGAKGGFVTSAQQNVASREVNNGHSHDSHDDHDHHDLDHDHPDDDGTSFLTGFTAVGGGGYGDHFENPTEVHRTDDYFSGRMSPIKVETSQVKARADIPSGPVGRHDNTFDDDFFNGDARLVFRPRPVVTIASSVFSVNPETLIAPVVPDGSGDTLSIGTEYLFNEVLTNAQNVNSQLAPVDVDGEQVLFIIALDGYCNRIGPADQNSVQGYCFLTYTFIDPATQLNSGSVTAQGIIVNSSVPGQLTITGGTGTMTGATGLVEILPASVNNDMNPPELVAPVAGSDPFRGVAGWAHFFEFDVDVLFFLPELYAR